MKWTQNQRGAIDTRNTDLLVSASAGSGKTTVMIERIFQMIQSGEATLDQLLVLTFTKASAADMRIKLRKKLENAGIDVIHLANCSIGTFHQFCSQLVQTYFNIAQIDPAFSIIDDQESKSIQSTILDKIIARNYENATDAIETLCASRKTEPLKELVISIYNFLCSRENSAEWLENIADKSYNLNLSKNLAIKKIVEHYANVGNHFFERFSFYFSRAKSQDIDRAFPFFEHCVELSKQLSNVKEIKDFCNLEKHFDFATLVKSYFKDFELYDEFKRGRDLLKDEIKEIQKYLIVDEKTLIQKLESDGKIINQIILLVQEFIKDYSNEKMRIGKLDFSDLEKFALKVLENEEIVNQLQDKYKFIFVDEYQDTNPVQEKILSLLNGKNLSQESNKSAFFMVGDIKQSIYGFRGAEPIIFASKLTNYDMNIGGQVVKLNENFRSHPGILGFVNDVFGKVMSKQVADIDYKTTSEFNPGAEYPDECEPAVEVILIDTKTEKREKQKIVKPYDILNDDSVVEELKKVEAQCALITQKIDQLLRTEIYDLGKKTYRKVQLGDIAILAKEKTHMNLLANTLARAGIECAVTNKQSASEQFEIAVLEKFLYAISNPYNDLPLVLTMSSFIFGFTSDDLATIKMASNQKNSFYEKILEYINSNNNELAGELADFVNILNEYHQFAKDNTVTAVLTKFLVQFGVIEKLLVTPNGEVMVSNIQNYLNTLSKATYAESLSKFLFMLENDMLQIEQTSGGGTRDRVQIMTIHKSKGLEFPIVILFDASVKFSSIESRKFMVIDRNYGLCMHSVDIENYKKSSSIARLGAKINAKNIQIAEEMRLLYVALTRAKNRLVIIGGCDVGKAREIIPSSFYEIQKSNNYIDFLSPVIFEESKNFSLKQIKLDQIKIISKTREQKVLSGEIDEKLVNLLKQTYEKESTPIIGADIVLKHSVTSLTKSEQNTIDFVPRKLFTEDRGVDYGTRFHGIMQRIDLETQTHEDKNIEKCLNVIRPILKNSHVLREVPFIQMLDKDGAKIMVQGIIDLVAISNDKIMVIDYKTTRASEQKIVELYTPQMQMYVNAIKQSKNIKNIESYIYSTVHEKLIKL
ncbi:MAG: UvrD-helicase domain-containing protein [Firmicutes bacterium]|nr:UvrD-helicase domain-containing protein [Bacillota bacterium]